MPDNQFIKAKITGKTLSSGTWLYSWKEQVQAILTGVDADPLSYRRGTSTNNTAVELNNTEVALDTIVFLRERGGYKGAMWYEFSAPDGTTSHDGGTGSTSAAGCGWVAALTAGSCLEVKVLGAGGRCACSNTVTGTAVVLTSGNGVTWTSPTPSGTPDCSGCPEGSPSSWTVTLSGGTGDFAALNGTYTLTRNSPPDGCTWSGGNAGLVVSGFSWTFVVTSGSTSATWTASTSGCCSSLTLTPGSNSGSGTVPTAGVLFAASACPGSVLICGVNYLPTFTLGEDCGGPCLTLTSQTGSGGTFKAYRESCGTGFADFALGNPNVCLGTTDCDLLKNVVRFRVRTVLCGWQGPGWYCARDCGGEDDLCAPVELLDGDQYATDIEICSGPYESETAVVEACGPVIVTCPVVDGVEDMCGDGTATRKFQVTISGITNGSCSGCNTWNGNFTLIWQPFPENTSRVCALWLLDQDGPIPSINCALGTGMVLDSDGIGSVVFGIVLGGGLYVRYVGTGWDCKSAITLNFDLDNFGGVCANYPATVTLTPIN